jgi:hypothetical protein
MGDAVKTDSVWIAYEGSGAGRTGLSARTYRTKHRRRRKAGRGIIGEDVLLMYLAHVISLACVSLLILLRQVHGYDLSAYLSHKGYPLREVLSRWF